ncbi:MAG TPA: M56 family metallopeptidase [Streptosporangiaceae bacterium]|nr:M56 family metallopeptidase [Streptosporangiaceae bacterium]
MSAAVYLLGAVAIGCVPAAHLLASASWPRRSPAVAIALWQAIGLGWGVATVGALAGVGAAGLDGRAGIGLSSVAGAAARAARLLLGTDSAAARRWDVLTGLRVLSLTTGILLLTLLCWILLAAVAAVLRARHRQRALLGLLAHDDPKVPGALVVDHPAAAAYCVPGLRSAIVISAGALDLLDQAELAAVLAHERAHLRARHDLVLLPFTALLRAFRWCAVAQEANREVALLVEMMADDRARRLLPARELATALLRVGASGGGAAPTGALAIAGGPATAASVSTGSKARLDGELAARVTRLLRPPPGLPVIAVMLLGTIAALLVVAPAVALLLPL